MGDTLALLAGAVAMFAAGSVGYLLQAGWLPVVQAQRDLRRSLAEQAAGELADWLSDPATGWRDEAEGRRAGGRRTGQRQQHRAGDQSMSRDETVGGRHGGRRA
mgnify:CR=1 FL=1